MSDSNPPPAGPAVIVAGADVFNESEALLARMDDVLEGTRHGHAERLSWIIVGAFGLTVAAVVVQSFIDPSKTLLTSVTKDYALLIEGPLGGVLGYFFAVRQKE